MGGNFPKFKNNSFGRRDAFALIDIAIGDFTLEGYVKNVPMFYNLLANFTSSYTDNLGRESSYSNSPRLELENYCVAYFGDECEPLMRLKSKWDNEGLFCSVQNIPLKN
jgi:hypothetical protein